MRNKLFGLFGALVISTAIAGVAEAAPTKTPRVDRRQVKQQQRIVQGVKSGELTARETVKLERGQVRVERKEQRAEADGVVTKTERAKLNHAQNVQSKRIARQKHDAQQQRR